MEHMRLKTSLWLILSSVWTLQASGYEFPAPQEKALHERVDDVETLQKISSGVSAIAEEANGALVFISVAKTVKGVPFNQLNPFDFFFGVPRSEQAPQREQQQTGLGSGFIVDLKRGLIVTNNHVIENADEIQVKLAHGKTFEATVVGRDPNTDIAVVEIKENDFDRKGIRALSFSEGETTKVGDFVVALGAPFGLEASMSFGIISALSRGSLGITELGNFIQTDAAINPGNSGGPLLDTSGRVIGVNTAIFSRSGAFAGIGFAVPSDLAKRVAQTLISDGKIERGYLGVGLQPLNPSLIEALNLEKNVVGAVITKVEENSPAAKADLKPSDVIVEVNGKEVAGPGQIANTIGLLEPGTEVELTVVRNGDREEIEVSLAPYPASMQAQSSSSGGQMPEKDADALGVTLRPLDPALQQQLGLTSNQGLVVTAIAPGSLAANAGLQVGDLLVSANQTALKSVEQFQKILADNKQVLLRVERVGEFFFTTVSVPKEGQS